MPNKSFHSPGLTRTLSSTTPTNSSNERIFGLRSLIKWGRSRSLNQVVVVVEATSSSSSSSSASSSTSTSTSLKSGMMVTEEESRGPATNSPPAHHHEASLSDCGEIIMRIEEESTSPGSDESETGPDGIANRKRPSSLDQLDTTCSEGATTANNDKTASHYDDDDGRGLHDHVHKQARSTLEDGSKKHNRFMSILDRPFKYWHELNMVLKEIHPEWSPYQRGRMIHHLIHFLELKIGKDDHVPTGLLLPTAVVDSAWRALVVETSLYLKVLYALQDFYSKDRAMIHYTLLVNRQLSPQEVQDKIRRTQSLFLLYFKETMPLSIEEEPRHPPAPVPTYTRPNVTVPTIPTTTTVTIIPTTPTPAVTTFGTGSTTTPTMSSDLQDATTTNPPTTTTPTPTTILKLSTLSLTKDHILGLPSSSSSTSLVLLATQEDDTASTQNSVFSGDDESEGLMGLELVED